MASPEPRAGGDKNVATEDERNDQQSIASKISIGASAVQAFTAIAMVLLTVALWRIASAQAETLRDQHKAMVDGLAETKRAADAANKSADAAAQSAISEEESMRVLERAMYRQTVHPHDAVISPGEPFPVEAFNVALGPADATDYMNRSISLRVWGCVWYTDRFGKERWKRFGRYITCAIDRAPVITPIEFPSFNSDDEWAKREQVEYEDAKKSDRPEWPTHTKGFVADKWLSV